MIGGLFLWSYPLNKGEVYIQTGVIDYTIKILNQTYSCKHDPCVIKLKSGEYQITFNREGYGQISSEVQVKRWGTTAIKLEPKKTVNAIATEKTIEESNPNPPLPSQIKEENIIGSAWNKDKNMMVFLDKTDSRVKIVGIDGKIRAVTVLKGITPPLYFYWSEDEKNILGEKGNDLYFIDVQRGLRKKHTLGFEGKNATWDPKGDFILLNNKENQLYKIEKIRYNDVISLKNTIDLSKTVWKDSNLAGYRIDDKKGKTTIFTYDLKEKKEEILMEKYNFPVGEIKISESKEILYLYQTTEKKWYEINTQ